MNTIQQTPKSYGYVILVSHNTRSTAHPFLPPRVVACLLWGHSALFLTAGHVPCILFWPRFIESPMYLTHWSRVKHIHIYSELCLPWLRQRLVATNAEWLSIRPYRWYYNEIWFIHSFKKMILKLTSGKCQPNYPVLNVLCGQLYIFDDSCRNGIHSVPVE